MKNAISNLLNWFIGTTIPMGAVAVKPFNIEKYLGTWYEIARMDFRFERNLNNVTATYSLKKSGAIKVNNRGFNYKTQKWKKAIGKAKFVGDSTEARIEVSFFGPFYAPYNVIAIDSEYRYALVAGKNVKYLWILSRETTIPEEIKQQYLALAQEIGFNTNALVWGEHTQV